MSEQSYRNGFHDGWFFDGDIVIDIDYEKGVVDGKKARLESDEKGAADIMETNGKGITETKKPKEIITAERESVRRKLSECFKLIQNASDSYEHTTGDCIKEVTFSRIDVAMDGAECQKFEIGRVNLIFY